MAITLGASLFASPIRVHTHARVRAQTQTQMAITLGVPLMCVMHKGDWHVFSGPCLTTMRSTSSATNFGPHDDKREVDRSIAQQLKRFFS